MVINHYANSTMEEKMKIFQRIYEIVVIGGKYYERQEQSERNEQQEQEGQTEETVCEP